jgi:tRNA-binding EMAP/Myf-like protein
MQDRKIIVVANLLPRKLVGFKSNGMVLCASSTGEDGKERVEFIDPPLSSVPGTVLYVYVYVYIYMCIYICVYICVYIFVYLYMYICIRLYIDI